MKIALIVTDKFKDYSLLEAKLDELKVSEAISGTTNGFEMLQKYTETRPNVKISLANNGSRAVIRAYNAINDTSNVVIFANGDGQRTEYSIANALNENKNLKIYSYKSKAFDIKKDGDYVKIALSGNLQKATKIEGIFLNKDEVFKLIEALSEVANNA